MATQTATSSKVSSSLDTSHLKVKFPYKAKYGNYINGKFVEPKSGKYFDNTTPITNEVICKVPRSNEKDIDFACMRILITWLKKWLFVSMVSHISDRTGIYRKGVSLIIW